MAAQTQGGAESLQGYKEDEERTISSKKALQPYIGDISLYSEELQALATEAAQLLSSSSPNQVVGMMAAVEGGRVSSWCSEPSRRGQSLNVHNRPG